MNIPTLTLTTAEVLADLFPKTGEGFTTPELAELWGCSSGTALRHVRKFVKSNVLIPVRVQRVDITGRRIPVPAYALADNREEEINAHNNSNAHNAA